MIENMKGNIRIKQTAASVIDLDFFIVRDLTIFRTKVCCAHSTHFCSGKIKIHPHVDGMLHWKWGECKENTLIVYVVFRMGIFVSCES